MRFVTHRRDAQRQNCRLRRSVKYKYIRVVEKMRQIISLFRKIIVVRIKQLQTSQVVSKVINNK